MRLMLRIQYEGTDYEGWQIQSRGQTIQGILQDCLYRLMGERVNLIGAGRTDSGVHALEQIATFDTSSLCPHPTHVIKRALNAMLPEDIRIIEVKKVDEGFHARYSSIRKRYTYMIADDPDIPVFIRRYVWWIKVPLNLDLMLKASSLLIGNHDFRSFMGSGSLVKNTTRTIYSIDMERMFNLPFIFIEFRCNLIKITIEADGFLRHMVRNIVGTLVQVGRRKIAPEMVKEILYARDRKTAGPKAPAKGLFLERVYYP